jgi:hypothetical protein
LPSPASCAAKHHADNCRGMDGAGYERHRNDQQHGGHNGVAREAGY